MTPDEQIRQAGSRLAVAAVPVPDLGRLVRRRRRIRTAAATGAVAALVGVGAVWLWPDPEPTRVETGTTEEDAVATYELDLDGVDLVSDEGLTARNTDVALWADESRQEYLSLAVRPGLADGYTEAPGGLGPMQEDTELPPTQGRAWFSETAGDPVRSMTMWWSRADGDVWMLRAYWHGQQPVRGVDARATMRDWALAIERDPTDAGQAPYVIGDPAMEIVAADDAGDLRSRARAWRWQGHEITLLATDDSVAAGLSNLRDRGVPEPVTVDGHDGWMVTSTSQAETVVGWALDAPRPTWVTLTIPPELSDQTDEVLAALAPE
jgi:hypothetical protein